jgi:hypothetical protein
MMDQSVIRADRQMLDGVRASQRSGSGKSQIDDGAPVAIEKPAKSC